jgi:hypothetical protein
MTRVVTTRYRYKRPTLKQEAVALEVPDVVRPKRKKAAPLIVEAIPSHPAIVGQAKPCNDNRPDPAPHDNDVAKSAIVTVRRRGKRFADVPDMTPEGTPTAR